MYLLGTQENFTVDDLVHLEERHKDDIPRLFDQFINDYEKLTTLPVADPPEICRGVRTVYRRYHAQGNGKDKRLQAAGF